MFDKLKDKDVKIFPLQWLDTIYELLFVTHALASTWIEVLVFDTSTDQTIMKCFEVRFSSQTPNNLSTQIYVP